MGTKSFGSRLVSWKMRAMVRLSSFSSIRQKRFKSRRQAVSPVQGRSHRTLERLTEDLVSELVHARYLARLFVCDILQAAPRVGRVRSPPTAGVQDVQGVDQIADGREEGLP
jgi:hypothetical protein